MNFILVCLVLDIVVEWGFLNSWWTPKIRFVLGLFLLVGQLGLSAALFVLYPNYITGFIIFISLYRAFNLYRVTSSQLNMHYIHQVSYKTFNYLAVSQLSLIIIFLCWRAIKGSNNITHNLLLFLALFQLIIVFITLKTVLRNLQKTKPKTESNSFNNQSLPTLTVCIPARNETEQLKQCLDSVIANDYPKLEILVLDDCSVTKKTPEIIRSYAHAGVQFIAGTPPPHGWLAKNWAYEQLTQASNGDVLLFCGVDIRFLPQSFRHLAASMLSKNKDMISVIPDYLIPIRWSVIQAMRYAWELCLPRRQFQKPPVLSSCWLITKSALLAHGMFPAERNAVVPEAGIAKLLIRSDKYSFLRSDRLMGVSSQKPVSEQRATAIRTRYPQLHRRPEIVALCSLFEIFLILMPFMMSLTGWFFSGLVSVAILSLLISVIWSIILVILLRAIMPHVIWSALLSVPVVIVTDVYLLHYSMWQYEFGTVTWKNRNICLPVMSHAIYK